MYRILCAEELTANIYKMEVEAPRVAAGCLPGQFLIVRTHADGERIPLTICDYDREKNTVTIVFQVVGEGTYRMAQMKAGDGFADVVGPLGKPSEYVTMPKEELAGKKLLFVAGGVGVAPVYPQVKWLHEHGVDADVIIGGRSKALILMEDEMKKVAGMVYVTTDDGSYGATGNVTVAIRTLCEGGKRYDGVVAIGPMIMMKFVCLTTKELGMKTIVSMNPVMVDGTGMCGGCRLMVGGRVQFACVDGPEFDGHEVDFDQAMLRSRLYKTEEGRAYLRAKEGDTHHGGCGNCGEEK